MEKNNHYIEFDEQVERYLRRQMTDEEARVFKQLLADNPALKRRARIIAMMIHEMRHVVAEESSEGQKLIQTVQHMSEAQFRQAAGLPPQAAPQVQAAAAACRQPAKPKAVRLWPRVVKYAVAACLAGVVALIGVRQYDASQYKALGHDPICLAYTPLLDEAGHDRGAGEAEPLPQQQAVMTLFRHVEQDTQVKEAVGQLQALYDQVQREGTSAALSPYQDDLAWYLAVGYLKLGKGRKAASLLEGIVQRGDSAQAAQAQKLLTRIRAL